jgi:hypothetical protein
LPHVYDVTHAIAGMLEKLYKNDAPFIKLTKDMGMMRLQLTPFASLFLAKKSLVDTEEFTKRGCPNLKILILNVDWAA